MVYGLNVNKVGEIYMKIYVIRHGQSETNLAQKWTGWLDVNLTNKGINDAKTVGEFLKNIHFDKIYTSDLSRAIETEKNALPNQPFEKSLLLREVNVGTLAGKPLTILTDEQRNCISKNGYTDFDGESHSEFYNRVCEFKKELEKSNAENIAIFTHAGWMREFLDSVVETRLPRKHVLCQNCALAIYEYSNNIWKLHSWINL